MDVFLKISLFLVFKILLVFYSVLQVFFYCVLLRELKKSHKIFQK